MSEISSSKAPHRARPGADVQAEHLLTASLELFTQRGSAAVSISQICKHAKVSRDTFYRCFSDKNQLLEQLYARAVDQPMQLVMQSPDMNYADPDWIQSTVEQTIDAIASQSDAAKFLFVESALPESPLSEVVQTALRKVAKRMKRWAVQHGDDSMPVEFYMALLMSAQWLVHDAIRKGGRKQDLKKAKQATAELFHRAFSSTQ